MGASEAELEIESFTCSYVDKIHILGKLYITQKRIGFYSMFNGKSLIGDTILSIPLQEVYRLQKATNFFGVGNTIIIETRLGNLEFTSFISRNTAFKFLDNILLLINPDYVSTKKNPAKELGALATDISMQELEEEVPKGSETKKPSKKEILERKFRKRTQQLIQSLPPKLPFQNSAYKYTFKGDYNKLIKFLLGKQEFTMEGKTYKSFWEYYQFKQGNTEISISDWSPELPANIANKKKLLDYIKPSERKTSGFKNLKHNIPLVPKQISFNETHQLYFINEKQAIMNDIVEITTKMPLSDAFKFHTCFVFRQEEENDVSIELRYEIEFLKSTMFKSQIVKTSLEECQTAGVLLNTLLLDIINSGYFENQPEEVLSESEDEPEEEAVEEGLEINEGKSSEEVAPQQDDSLGFSTISIGNVNCNENKDVSSKLPRNMYLYSLGLMVLGYIVYFVSFS